MANFSPIDLNPPTIFNLMPANGTSTNSGLLTIGASYSDDTAVDTSTVILKVDGVDVGGQVSPNGITYAASLQPGTHTMDLAVKDIDGNEGTATWNVVVIQPKESAPMDLFGGIVIAIVAVVMVTSFLLLRSQKPVAASPGTEKKRVGY
jgi:hypothetical protein